MSTERDPTRIVLSWLRSDEHVSADRILDVVLFAVDTTPQRRSAWLAWRSPFMSNTVRVALAAAAVVVAALIGYQLFIVPNIGGPAPTPNPTVPEPVASPTPSTSAVAFPLGVDLTPGTYVLNAFPVDLTFELGEGWYAAKSTPSAAILLAPPGVEEGRLIAFFIVGNVYADPCDAASGELDPPVGPSIDELVSGLTSAPGFHGTPAIDATVGAFQGKEFVLTADEPGLGCSSALAWTTDHHQRDFAPGEASRVQIVDAEGVRLLIDTGAPSEVDSTIQAEVESVLDSLRIPGP